MNSNCGVAEHRFGARRRNRDDLVRAFDRIIEVPEIALHFDLHHFKVGNRCLEFWIPVHETFVAINQTLLVECDKHFEHGA